MNGMVQDFAAINTVSEPEVPCILIRVEDRDIHTQQFKSFDDAQNQMIDEMIERCNIPKETFEKWNGSLMVEDEYGNWAFWSDGGYRKSKYFPIDWQIVEVEV